MSNTLRDIKQYQYEQQAISNAITPFGGSQFTGVSTGQFQYGYTYPNTFPTIQIVPVPIPQEPYDYRKAVQVLYRFNLSTVQACVIKGTNDVEQAKRVFLGQFSDTDEPEIVAAVIVAL